MERKLFNSKNELFALMLFCESPELASEMMQVCRSEEWFALPWARKAYKRIKELYKGMSAKDGVVAFTTLIADDELPDDVKDRLESGRKKFKDEVIDKKAVIDSLERFRKLRKLNELVEKANDMLADPSVTDPNKIITEIESHIVHAKSSSANIQECIYSVGEEFSMEGVLEAVFSDDKQTFIPTGVKEFDDRNGGINLGSTFLIAGTTGGGKTLTAMNVAEHMALHAKVAYVPLEMTAAEMVQRQMAKHGRVPVNTISAKKWTEEEQEQCLEGYKAFHRKVKSQGNTFSIFKPDMDLTIDEVFMALHPYDYEVICIDYISLLKGVDGDDAWRKLNEASRAAKVYASTHNKVVILLAQLNDEGSLRYSKGLLDHFNNAWFFVANQNTKERGFVSVTQPKARNADPTPFDLEIEYEYMAIGESSVTKVDVRDPKEKPKNLRELAELRRKQRKRRDEEDTEDDEESEVSNDKGKSRTDKPKPRPDKERRTRERPRRPEPEDDEDEEETPRKRKPAVSKPKRRRPTDD